MTRTAYIAGPMRGIAAWNRPAFEETASVLQSLGFETIIPHDIDPRTHEGTCPPVYGAGMGEHDSGCYLRACIAEVMLRADLVVVLPGWGDSKGATEEVLAADGVDIPVVEADVVGEYARTLTW